ncbi:hypothetical protein U9M48_016222 [Paspalum notatum var. saurae]|uniref:WRKY domain-containing protein n=1 Tax=Paspalum notatum var. saurae TaxID=547442 RepID=A0AAQ3WMW0_PASNO
MASSSAGGAADGDGRSSPRAAAAAPRELVDDLIDVRERATMLQTILLQGSSPPTPMPMPMSEASRYASAAPEGTSELIDRIMSRLASALSTLDTTGGGGGGGQLGQVQQQGRRRKKGAAAVDGSGSGPQRRSNTTRRRSHSPFVETITTSTLDDGKSWRKYGQKIIQDSPNNPRSYYRCTHKPDQGCRATRQVQTSDANPSEFVISYYGQHTCRDPSTIPLVIQEDTTPPPDCANLISFGSTVGGGSASSTHTAVVPPQAAFDPMTMTSSSFSGLFGIIGGYSCSLPAQASYRCGSEEVHSSSGSPSPAAAQQPAAVVGSAAGVAGSSATAVVGSSAGVAGSSATVGSAPAEYWPRGGASSDMACGRGTGSFPSSPSSLGFMTGSFGSFGDAGDDDLFGFDP